MNAKIIAGAVIALAAGVAAFIYNRNRSKINEAASDLYDASKDAMHFAEKDVENVLA